MDHSTIDSKNLYTFWSILSILFSLHHIKKLNIFFQEARFVGDKTCKKFLQENIRKKDIWIYLDVIMNMCRILFFFQKCTLNKIMLKDS